MHAHINKNKIRFNFLPDDILISFKIKTKTKPTTATTKHACYGRVNCAKTSKLKRQQKKIKEQINCSNKLCSVCKGFCIILNVFFQTGLQCTWDFIVDMCRPTLNAHCAETMLHFNIKVMATIFDFGPRFAYEMKNKTQRHCIAPMIAIENQKEDDERKTAKRKTRRV